MPLVAPFTCITTFLLLTAFGYFYCTIDYSDLIARVFGYNIMSVFKCKFFMQLQIHNTNQQVHKFVYHTIIQRASVRYTNYGLAVQGARNVSRPVHFKKCTRWLFLQQTERLCNEREPRRHINYKEHVHDDVKAKDQRKFSAFLCFSIDEDVLNRRYDGRDNGNRKGCESPECPFGLGYISKVPSHAMDASEKDPKQSEGNEMGVFAHTCFWNVEAGNLFGARRYFTRCGDPESNGRRNGSK